jgi:hypothetical protein
VWFIESEREHIATCFTLVSCLGYFSTFKMEATCSSETLVDSSQLLSASQERLFSMGPEELRSTVQNTCL